MFKNKIEVSLYNADIITERKLWQDLFSKGLILTPKECPNCAKNISIIEHNTMINPYVGRCCNPKCRKTIYLRTQSLFDLYSKTPISILKYIVTLSLIHSKNTNEIYDYLSKSCESTAISKNHILNILKTMRELIAKYLDDTYKREYIAEENGQDSISVDES